MRRISLLVLVAAIAATSAFSQPRSLGASRLVLDDGASNFTYVTSGNGVAVSVLPGYIPSACAILDLNANTAGAAKLGFIGPRVAEVDKINVCGGVPPAGTLIYNSTFNYYEYFNGAVWAPVVAGWSLHGNGSTIPPAAATTPAPVAPGDYFLGTLDNVDFAIVTNSAQRVRIEGDNAAAGNTVEILNDGATATGLKIYANGGTGMSIDPASTGILLDATGTGIEFTNSMPAIGIDLSNGTTATGMIIDNSPIGIEIGNGAPGGQGIVVNATIDGITVGNITPPNDGLDVNATSTGVLVGTGTQPNFGLDVDAAITGANIDAPTIGIDVGQTTPSMLGIGVRSVGTGIDVQEQSGGTGINVNVGLGTAGGIITNNFGTLGLQVNSNNSAIGVEVNANAATYGQVINNNSGADGLLVQQGNGAGFGINLDGNTFGGTSIIGLDVSGYNTSIQTDGPSSFGDGFGADNHTFNNGTGDMTVNLAGGASDLILNGIDQVVPPGPFDNVLYLNGNVVDQTPNGTNIVTGSGALNTIPLWTPNGFTLGNSIVTQEANASGINVTPTGAGGTNVVEINNFNATQTAVKINANGGVGMDIDPASTGIIIDATATGIDYQGSTPTTGINLRGGTTGINYSTSPVTGIQLSSLTTGINFANAPTTGINVQAVNTGINFLNAPITGILVDATTRGIQIQDGPTLTGSSFFMTGTTALYGHEVQIGGAGGLTTGFMLNTIAGSTGDIFSGFEIVTDGDNAVQAGALLANRSPNATGDWFAGLQIEQIAAGDITTGIRVADFGGAGAIPTGIDLLNVGTGITITSLGGTSITGNQNFISTGGFGRFANGVATNTAAPAPVGNQVTWFNTNSGTLSTQVLAAPRTWLLPDETGVLDAYDPLNNNGFVYFQPEVPQVGSAAAPYSDNPLISLQGLATTPNGIVVDMSTNPAPSFASAVQADITASAGALVNGGVFTVTGNTAQTIGVQGFSTSTDGVVYGTVGLSQAFGTGTAYGAYGQATANSGDAVGAFLSAFSATGDAFGASIIASGFGAISTGVAITAMNATANNTGAHIRALGAGSIGVDVDAGARTGMRITDIDAAGASTGILIDKTTASGGTTQALGIHVNNASTVAGSTITDGMLVSNSNSGSIVNGYRASGPTTGYLVSNIPTTSTGFSSDLSTNVGFNSEAATGTGYQATSVTGGTGFSANVTGGGNGVNVTVGGSATGKGVVSTNTSTGTGSKAGVFVGNNGATGATNIAMQIERGELTMGRESGAQGAGVAVAETGVNEGPSGVVDISAGFAIQNGGTIDVVGPFTINNQHVSASSIILLTVLDNDVPLTTTISAQVLSRAGGTFNISLSRVVDNAMVNVAADATVRVAYMVINPDR